MNRREIADAIATSAGDAVLNALPHPIVRVAADGRIVEANVAAEAFFETSAAVLCRHSVR